MTGRRLAYTSGAAAALGLFVAGLAAAQPPGQALTLQAATERAFAANPTIAAARLLRAVNLAGVGVAGERLNPEATVEIEKETPKQAFGIGVPFELGGKRGKRIAVSQAALRTGEAELSATLSQVRNDVRRAYFDVLVATARLTLLRELRNLAQRARDAAQARFETGDAPRLEVLQASLALNAAQSEATSADGVVAAATTRFNALLGAPLNATQQLTTPIDSGGPVDVRLVLDLARSQSAELTILDRRIEEQRAKLTLAQALRVPDVVSTVTLTHDAEPEFTYGWRAGIAVTVPLFTTHKASVAVEEATLAQLTAQREATRLRIEADVTAAAAFAETNRLAYERYRDEIIPAAQEVEQLAQDSYRLGQTGIAALLQALQATRDVRLRSLDAVLQFQTALADLERAIGAPLP